MSAKMYIVLEGLPERVQETADVMDRAFPGLMTWCHFAEAGRDQAVRLEGKALDRKAELSQSPHHTKQTAASGKAWKLSPAAGRVSPQRGTFCASLSKNLLP